MNPKKYLLTTLGATLMLASCQTEQLPTDKDGFAPGQERSLVLTPVVSPTATRAVADPAPVTLIGGNLALTLSKNATDGAPIQIAVYGLAAPAEGSAASPLVYNHEATRAALTAQHLNPDDARALYVTAAGSYPLVAVGTRLKATTMRTEQMKPHPDMGMGTDPVTTFATLPFALHASRTAADAPIDVAADGTASLPLHIASAGVMLRMKYFGKPAPGGKSGIVIDSVHCLPADETAPRIDEPVTDEAARTVSRVVSARVTASDGKAPIATEPDNMCIDYVLFGTLAAGQALAKGDALVEINATITTLAADGLTPVVEKKTFTVLLPRDVTPQAGQLLTYTVYVNQTIASIVGEVQISGFAPGNGGGQDIGVGGKL